MHTFIKNDNGTYSIGMYENACATFVKALGLPLKREKS
jgi:hypothetical protein